MPDADRLRTLFEIGAHPLRHRSTATVRMAPYIEERLLFETESSEPVGGALTRPAGAGPFPAILYLHAHGGRYEIGAAELTAGRPALQGPLGPVFASLGYVSLCIDMPGFGGRSGASESALAKARLWRGKSLAGQMLGEQASLLDWLAGRPFVDAARIGAFGISMGATFAYWLAAVEPRIACVAQLCCYADFETLIEIGAHDLHGIYLTVPGLLDTASNGALAGMVAPRAQFIAIGDRDPLTPPAAVDRALAQTRAAYAAAGSQERLVLHREAETGHAESPAMRAAMLAFLAGQFGR